MLSRVLELLLAQDGAGFSSSRHFKPSLRRRAASIELSYKATGSKQRNRPLLSQSPIKRIGYFLFLVGKIKEGPLSVIFGGCAGGQEFMLGRGKVLVVAWKSQARRSPCSRCRTLELARTAQNPE
jgi:hypothetical protein